MRTPPWVVLAALAIAPSAFAGVLEPVLDVTGKLDPKDSTLEDGSYAEVWSVDLNAGDRVLVDMASRKFDTYVALRSPGGEVFENDDLAGDKRRSQLDVIAEESGTWTVYATSFVPATKGSYTLRVSVDRSGGAGGAPRGKDDASPSTMVPNTPMSGTLQQGDAQLDAGEWADMYTIELSAGQQVTADLRSSAFDTYIALQAPSGAVLRNDDHEGDRALSRIQATVEETGTWRVYATTYAAGQGGPYSLLVSTQSAPSQAGVQRWSGSLGAGDATLTSGEYLDRVTVTGRRGDHWVIDLRSTAFDPFLMVKAPSGTQHENDDFEGARDRSVLDLVLEEDGEYMLGVTTYKPGMQGAWDLTLRQVTGSQVAPSGPRRFEGTLAAGDTTLTNGEWYDLHTFEGVTGQSVQIRMTGDFDTYLGLNGPGSFNSENDDAPSGDGSLIEAVLPETGTYRLVATSYQAGQGGRYAIEMTQAQGSVAASAQRDTDTLTSGVPYTGRLEAGDRTLTSGEFQDLYTIEARAGQLVTAQVRSSAFDPYVGLGTPSGDFVENDDWQGQRDLARIEMVAPEDGRYRVVATSYAVGSMGAYEVTATVGGTATVVSTQPAVTSESRTFGVFVGISDYPTGGPGDLSFTADDAVKMHQGMLGIGMRPEDGRLLTDAAATKSAVTGAIRELAARMGPSDRLIFFYSGHGGRLPVAAEQAADPDGMDETLVFYDGEMRDDEFADLATAIRQGTLLMVLDSCFSGGFSKDVITKPGRMGLFSSHEDVTSAVAFKFRAGGYLAQFMVDAIADRRADEDADRAVTAIELSSYLYERYRADVKSTDKGADDIVLTGDNLGYQQLIVDRGGIGPSQVLFRW